MTPQERDLIETVASNLRYLRDNWRPNADNHTLRRNSNLLRMLVVDDLYGRAWRALGLSQQPSIVALDLATALDAAHPEWLFLALAGGSGYNGMTFGPAFVPTDAMPPEARARWEGVNLMPSTMPITQFRDSLCMIVYGVPVSRRHVIQYVANTRGGAHFGPSRSHSGDLVIHQALDFITDDPRKAPIQLDIPPKPLVYHDLLAIGRCLALAPDTMLYLERAEQALQ
jgi:hypothetical protein